MLFGEPYVIDTDDSIGTITITLPSVGDIVKIGYDKFFMNLNCFVTNTTQYRLMLWEEMNMDWNTTSDFELFVMLYKNLDLSITKLLFGDLDFSQFVPFTKYKNEQMLQMDDNEPSEEEAKQAQPEIILWNNEAQVEINENVYNHISQYLRTAFGINPVEKITSSETLKQWYIMKDKNELKNKINKKDAHEEDNSFLSVISACLVYPGFKYNSKQLKDICIAEFYEAYQQIQYYIQKEAYIFGLYSGFVDSKNVQPESLSILR